MLLFFHIILSFAPKLMMGSNLAVKTGIDTSSILMFFWILVWISTYLAIFIIMKDSMEFVGTNLIPILQMTCLPIMLSKNRVRRTTTLKYILINAQFF